MPEIDSLILIDRSTDLVTPLLTQMTYEGLVDEMFGITNSFIEIDAELVGGGQLWWLWTAGEYTHPRVACV